MINTIVSLSKCLKCYLLQKGALEVLWEGLARSWNAWNVVTYKMIKPRSFCLALG